MNPPLDVLSGMHSKSAKSWVLGLWSPCTRRLCASSWSNAHLSRVLFSSFAFICGKKEDIESAQWWVLLIGGAQESEGA